jgi:hypothetical protein
MVDAARHAAAELGVQHRATFVRDDATRVGWGNFDAIYLYNPFAEALFRDDADELARRDAYVANVIATQQRLDLAPVGTRVVTYFGFGGDMPPGYTLVHTEPAGEDELRVWDRIDHR